MKVPGQGESGSGRNRSTREKKQARAAATQKVSQRRTKKNTGKVPKQGKG
jgi:hypothetical protein